MVFVLLDWIIQVVLAFRRPYCGWDLFRGRYVSSFPGFLGPAFGQIIPKKKLKATDRLKQCRLSIWDLLALRVGSSALCGCGLNRPGSCIYVKRRAYLSGTSYRSIWSCVCTKQFNTVVLLWSWQVVKIANKLFAFQRVSNGLQQWGTSYSSALAMSLNF